ncbi:MAG: acetyl-coenzyme A synthetase N-terminal domain-containing protein, partial [Pseudomonadota bacterium]|nr:acetyl-coenzyme A synthetase N-terminal domain-containing protein [Pseudomonadota bacterium]
MGYSDVYASWKADPEGFWMNAAKAIDWASPPSKALDDSNGTVNAGKDDAPCCCAAAWSACDSNGC